MSQDPADARLEPPTDPEPAARPGADSVADPSADPQYQAAVVDLLGVLAYGELTGFSRLGADSDLAPTLTAKAEMAALAVARFGHFERLMRRLTELGLDPEAAMEPFVVAVDAFHERTAPSTWLEGLVKAYVGEGISNDFYREISVYVDPVTRDLVTEVLADSGQAEFVVREVRGAIEADPRLTGRLALWGRRLVGEALSQAQRVAADRDALASLMVGSVDRPGADLAELVRMFGRLTEAHSRRMGLLGLSA
jgi:tRNA-(MS[2]IO[6]A)-hydroxylase (MiaE)-like